MVVRPPIPPTTKEPSRAPPPSFQLFVSKVLLFHFCFFVNPHQSRAFESYDRRDADADDDDDNDDNDDNDDDADDDDDDDDDDDVGKNIQLIL